MHRLRTDVFSHLQRQSLAFFTRTRTGEVQSRITNDIGGMQSVVTSTATAVAANLTTVIATAVAMIALSWQLSLVSLVVLPPAIWLTRRVARMRREITAQRQRELADLNVTVEEGLSVSGVQLAKTLGTGPALIDRFAASSARLVDLELRSELAGRWRMAAMSIIFAAVPAVIYLAAGLPGTAGTLSIGTLVAFTALQGGLFRPLMGLLNVGVSLTASLALFARIFEYLDLPVDVADPAEPVHLDPTRVHGHLRLEDVTFGYPGSDTAALAGVTLDVPAGTSLALVGETGSGKSTLAGLVSRLHDPTGGRVTIDGVDLRDLRLADLASIVGVVSQETYLLHTTVRENLRYARPDATDAQVEAAARAAQIHDLIADLPDGYDTVVGSRGHRFSGGEKQRLAIARTLLRDPRILVLDEATSALDTETERAVQRAFDLLAEDAPRSPSPTGSPPSVTPTRSRCSTTAGSSKPAPTTACCTATAATPPWPPERGVPPALTTTTIMRCSVECGTGVCWPSSPRWRRAGPAGSGCATTSRRSTGPGASSPGSSPSTSSWTRSSPTGRRSPRRSSPTGVRWRISSPT
ncbi:hypothetical protein GCM10027614_06630 [Micromonospora vulcania]